MRNLNFERKIVLFSVSSWVEEFVGNPNHGHVALIDLVKDLADHPASVPRKNSKKYTVLHRDPVNPRTDEYVKHSHSFYLPLELPPQCTAVSEGLDSTQSEFHRLYTQRFLTGVCREYTHRLGLLLF